MCYSLSTLVNALIKHPHQSFPSFSISEQLKHQQLLLTWITDTLFTLTNQPLYFITVHGGSTITNTALAVTLFHTLIDCFNFNFIVHHIIIFVSLHFIFVSTWYSFPLVVSSTHLANAFPKSKRHWLIKAKIDDNPLPSLTPSVSLPCALDTWILRHVCFPLFHSNAPSSWHPQMIHNHPETWHVPLPYAVFTPTPTPVPHLYLFLIIHCFKSNKPRCSPTLCLVCLSSPLAPSLSPSHSFHFHLWFEFKFQIILTKKWWRDLNNQTSSDPPSLELTHPHHV